MKGWQRTSSMSILKSGSFYNKFKINCCAYSLTGTEAGKITSESYAFCSLFITIFLMSFSKGDLPNNN